MMNFKRKRYENTKILKACKDPGVSCTVQLPGCEGPEAPTVPAHSNMQAFGKGKSIKADDCAAAISCNHCHDIYDGRLKPPHVFSESWGRDVPMSQEELQWYHMRAIIRTIRIMIDMGVLK